jgi:GNAT superfamily N-acetyltransferase
MKRTIPQDAGAGPEGLAVDIGPAREDEAAAILAVQKAAYRAEAELNQDWTIPPLTQTLEEMGADIRTLAVLTARSGGRCVGSVRARLDGEVCHVGRLIVDPDWQGRGIGSRLLAGIQDRFPQAREFTLFTGARSAANLAFYEKRGYRITRRERVNDALTLVHLVRANAPQRSQP